MTREEFRAGTIAALISAGTILLALELNLVSRYFNRSVTGGVAIFLGSSLFFGLLAELFYIANRKPFRGFAVGLLISLGSVLAVVLTARSALNDTRISSTLPMFLAVFLILVVTGVLDVFHLRRTNGANLR